MTPEARAFLDQLDDLCLKGDQTARDVMAVLTALRSHDVRGDTSFKAVTTVPIRRAALPKCAAAADAQNIDHPRTGGHDVVRVGESGRLTLLLRDGADEGRIDLHAMPHYRPNHADRHFATHAMLAAKVLGLKVVS